MILELIFYATFLFTPFNFTSISKGQVIKTVFNKFFTQGEYLLDFDGVELNNGIYFLKFNNSKTTTVKKIIASK